MTSRIVAVALLGLLLAPPVAEASEQSKVLSSRGLVEFHAGRFAEALELFGRAVDADPEDVYALYYRAVTRARLDDEDGAIADLRAVLAARPDLDQAALDLGVALIGKKQYQDALPWLEQAQGDSDLAGRASLFLGLAQLRLGQPATARQNFERAATDPEQQVAARYYIGVADYQEGNWSGAATHFAYVAETEPESATGREAAAFLATLRQAEGRWYQVYGALGFQYDSNVILAPSSGADQAQTALDVTQQGDGRFTIGAGGIAVPWRNDFAEVSVGYDFFQSLHFELSDFNLQDHAPSAQISGQIGRFRLGLLSRYDYYLLKDQSFLQQATALPWLTVYAGRIGRTELFYNMQWRDYKQKSFAVLDAFDHAVGVRQVVYIGSLDRFVWLGYQFNRSSPDIDHQLVREGVFTKQEADSYAYDGNEIGGGVAWPLPLEVRAELGYEYRHERYDPESGVLTPSGNRRHDDQHQVILALRKPVWKYVELTAAYFGEFTLSNDPRFEYDRNIGSLALEVRF